MQHQKQTYITVDYFYFYAKYTDTSNNIKQLYSFNCI